MTRRQVSIITCAIVTWMLQHATAEEGNRGRPLKEMWPWYHSGDELHAKLQEIASACTSADLSISANSKMNVADRPGEQVTLDVLRVRGHDSNARVKALFVFGEHARELITGEAALGLVQSLCGQGPYADRAKKVLDGVEFVIVPNANPLSRKQVEDGYYCKRTNEDGVDLNRNWSEEHRDLSQKPGEEMYPGPGAFSEPETQLLRELVDQETPDIYLSVHSGAYLLGTPWGYQSRAPEDESAMMEVLRPISSKYCEGRCPYGNLAKLINYENPGCDIDYVYQKLGTPYVFTWEIFVGDSFRDRYEEEARRQQDDASASFAQRGRRLRKGRVSASLEAEDTEPEAQQEVASCIEQFNPQTEETTAAVVRTWSGAFLELCEEVSSRKAKSIGA